MLTVFGKYLRKIRIDNDEILNDMAEKLSVTAAYPSAVENGKREIPKGWIEEVGYKYGLNDKQFSELREAAISSRKSIKIELSNETDRDRDLLIAFARRFRDLNDDEVQTIKKILNNKRGV